jgi:hypothetical protein
LPYALFHRIDFSAALNKINDSLFACGYGVLTALILPFVNIAVQRFIYFQF